jgi:hypothetical protein
MKYIFEDQKRNLNTRSKVFTYKFIKLTQHAILTQFEGHFGVISIKYKSIDSQFEI